jgi:hypothetical protein
MEWGNLNFLEPSGLLRASNGTTLHYQWFTENFARLRYLDIFRIQKLYSKRNASAHTHTRAHTHARAHAHVHTSARTHAHAHIHIRKHTIIELVLIVSFFGVSETDPNTLSLQSDTFYPLLVSVVNKP